MTKQRLLEFIEFKKITIQKFFEITGIKRGFLDSDKLNQAVSDKHFAMIFASFPEISPDWLITGNGEMLRKNNSNINHEEDLTSLIKILERTLIEKDRQIEK